MAIKRRYINEYQEGKGRRYTRNEDDLEMDRNRYRSPAAIERKQGINESAKMWGDIGDYSVRNGIRSKNTAFENGNAYFDPTYRAQNPNDPGNAVTKQSQKEKEDEKKQKLKKMESDIRKEFSKKQKNRK